MLKPVMEIETSADKSHYIVAPALLVLSATNADRSSDPLGRAMTENTVVTNHKPLKTEKLEWNDLTLILVNKLKVRAVLKKSNHISLRDGQYDAYLRNGITSTRNGCSCRQF